MLLLLVLAVKNEGGVGCYEKGIVPMERWNPKMLNPNEHTQEAVSKTFLTGKKEMMPTLEFHMGILFSKKESFC